MWEGDSYEIQRGISLKMSVHFKKPASQGASISHRVLDSLYAHLETRIGRVILSPSSSSTLAKHYILCMFFRAALESGQWQFCGKPCQVSCALTEYVWPALPSMCIIKAAKGEYKAAVTREIFI